VEIGVLLNLLLEVFTAAVSWALSVGVRLSIDFGCDDGGCAAGLSVDLSVDDGGAPIAKIATIATATMRPEMVKKRTGCVIWCLLSLCVSAVRARS
jgi:hypothetical protein